MRHRFREKQKNHITKEDMLKAKDEKNTKFISYFINKIDHLPQKHILNIKGNKTFAPIAIKSPRFRKCKIHY
jgi:hypothetical protein